LLILAAAILVEFRLLWRYITSKKKNVNLKNFTTFSPMNTTYNLLWLIWAVILALCWTQTCLLNENIRLSEPLASPTDIISFDNIANLQQLNQVSSPLTVSTWEGGVTAQGSTCYVLYYDWGLGGPSWRSGSNWHDGINMPGYFMGANGASTSSGCIITFPKEILSFSVRTAANNAGTGYITAIDTSGNAIACISFNGVTSSTPTNYYEIHGIQSNATNIKSILFSGNFIVVDEIRFYGPSLCTLQSDGTACDDGNACTQTDTCQSGQCVGSNPVTCTALDQCHDVGTCDSSNGQCSNPSKPDATECDDGDLCSQTDTCQSGQCVGSNPVTCIALDQCHDVGTCDNSNGQCSNPSKPDTTVCDDENLCTQTDTCQSGQCVGSNPVTCTALDQCHDVGTCDSSNGQCSNPSKPDATECDDGDLCSQIDTCQSGQCVGSNPVTCIALDQCHDVGTCDSSNGQCSNPSKPDTTNCDDGSLCTQTDTCQSGQCVGSNPVICNALSQCHDVGTCDGATGQCSQPVKSNGTSCDDEDACTQEDICEEGTCIGINPVTCSALNQCHDVGTCDTTTGQCSQPLKANNSTCDDGDACTDDDVCLSGMCRGVDSCPVAPPQEVETPIAITPIIPPQYHQFVPENAPAAQGKISSATQKPIALYLGIFVYLVKIFM
jgi:hypothetical protein